LKSNRRLERGMTPSSTGRLRFYPLDARGDMSDEINPDWCSTDGCRFFASSPMQLRSCTYQSRCLVVGLRCQSKIQEVQLFFEPMKSFIADHPFTAHREQMRATHGQCFRAQRPRRES